MAETETISAPAQAVSENTDTSSAAPEVNTETAQTEPENNTEAAENGTEAQEDKQQEAKLYAGKYKSIEDFEEGHKNLNAELTRLQQWKSEQMKQIEAQNAYKIEQARQSGV